LDQLLQKFEGHKNEYDRSLNKSKYLLSWKYRVKTAEKIYYMMISVFVFVFYKSPSLTQMILYDNAHLAIPLFALSIIMFNYSVWYLDKAHARSDLKTKKLKQIQKDVKMQLLTQMDPIVVETLREIVRKDMKSELEDMKNSDQGCSRKCQLMKKIADTDIERTSKIVKVMIGFEWCDSCSDPDQKHLSGCKKGCGKRLVKECIPVMRDYGDQEEELATLKKALQQLNDK